MNELITAALVHRAGMEYRYFADGEVTVRLRAAVGSLDKAELYHGRRYDPGTPPKTERLAMAKTLCDDAHDWYEASFQPADPRICYYFRIVAGGSVAYLLDCGVRDAVPDNRNEWFFFPYIHESDAVPLWARGAVVYEAFVDRFAREGPAGEFSPWGTPPAGQRMRCGGNLAGIRGKLPYLKELGVDILYLTPIFASPSNHRYDTADYMTVDAVVGTGEELRDLADELHARGMKLVLDGVFNHCSTQFFAFKDVLERGEASRYRDWFTIRGFPVSVRRGAYAAFADLPSMPKLNLCNTETANYFCEVGCYWLRECHADGWRLDVANETDPDFLRRFCAAVRSARPNALIVSEIWNDAFGYVGSGMPDAAMNYPFTYPIWERIADDNIFVSEFAGRLNRALSLYAHPAQQAGWSIIGTHDTSRFLTRARGDLRKLHAAAFLQFTCPGAPLVYYGDELGMEGGPDPDCRRCMPWDHADDGNATLALYRKLAKLRHELPALRLGRFRALPAGHPGVYAFIREYQGQAALAAANLADGEARCTLPLPLPTAGMRLGEARATVCGGELELELPPWSFVLLA